MADAPLDLLNSLTMILEAMLEMGTEVSVEEFEEFQSEIHASVARLKKAGLWLRQIMPLIAPSIHVLQRLAAPYTEFEHGLLRLSKESSALVELVEAFESGETILFSDEMTPLVPKEPSTSSSSKGF